ncbi:MAG: YggW family oxidoreductase, partial [Kangiellaceae bacterium]|nr:YggW family oxidoreductase [Kangiellaceae bacterium]
EPPPIPDDEIAEDIAEAGLELLNAHRYQRYEVSAYSLNGTNPSIHNLNYWQFGDYLGIGAGAHGKITRADEQTISRTSKRRSPKDYLNKSIDLVDNTRLIPAQELPLEFMMNALRLKKGVPRELFFNSTGILIEQISSQIKKACNGGLLQDDGAQLTPTEQGYRFLNQLLEHFMPENFPQLGSEQKINIKSVD